MAYGNNGTNAVATSSDGINWVESAVSMVYEFQSVAWNGNIFVATATLSDSLTGNTTILTSSDGQTWIDQKVTTFNIDVAKPYQNRIYSIIWSGAQFVALSSVGNIFTSADGITWQQVATVASKGSDRLGQGGGKYFVTREGYGTDVTDLFISNNAINWTAVDIPFLGGYLRIKAFAWTGSLYIAAADSGTFGGESIMCTRQTIR
ncbi:MAG: hypothetical protein R8M45_09000 [Ghiorsea sp.]